MEVRCSHCTTPFVLPEELLGPGGARVRCPSCGGQFEVAREPRRDRAGSGDAPWAPPIAPSGAPERLPAPEAVAASAIAPPPAPASPAEAAARGAVDAIAERLPAVTSAWRRGRLFAETGTVLLAAFDDYRRRAGSSADPATFRRVLEERSGIMILAPRDEPDAGGGGPLPRAE